MQAPVGLLEPLPIPSHRFGSWSMDFITHLPECNGFNAMYTCIDHLSGLVRLTPCTHGAGEMSAAAMAKLFFNAVVRQFGLPDDIVHNRDAQFTADLWRELWTAMGTKTDISIGPPSTNGWVNQTDS